jgi:pilus assembly protein Flp/PilA
VRKRGFTSTAANFINQLKSDEDGASLVEYTVLLGIILVAVFAIIAAVASWINTEWATLNTAV